MRGRVRLDRHPDLAESPWVIAALIALVLSLIIGLEWLFVVTKPSFADLMSWAEKLRMLVVCAGLFPLLVGGAVGLLLYAASFPLLSSRYTSWLYELLANVVLFVLSAFLAMLVVLLVDNFTNTLFDVGIGRADGGARDVYALLLGALLFLAYRKVADRHRRLSLRSLPRAWSVALAYFGLGGLVLAIALAGVEEEASGTQDAELWNVVILSSDGIEAGRMSVYGAERDTTPYLRANANDYWIFEQALTNGADSGASIASMLTGKYPTTTRLVYPPDALRGADAYQHLPGILKRNGYYNGDVSVRHYVDPFDLNMRDGFHEANGRAVESATLQLRLPSLMESALSDERLLLETIGSRIVERYQHMFDIRDMSDAFRQVQDAETARLGDREREQLTWDFLNRAPEPFFLHVHLLAPHGERFRPKNRVFSADKVQAPAWDMNFYDDTLRDFDDFIAEVEELLAQRDVLGRTLIVISSDHGIRHSVVAPVPLLFRAPDASRIGRVSEIVERLDIAPTILDFLGLSIPSWMEGRSLLRPTEGSPIVFSTAHARAQREASGRFVVADRRPPYFSLGRIRMIQCGQGWTFHVSEARLEPLRTSSITANDDCDAMADPGSAIREHLAERDYRE